MNGSRHGRVLHVVGQRPPARRRGSRCIAVLVGSWGWFNRGPGRWVR